MLIPPRRRSIACPRQYRVIPRAADRFYKLLGHGHAWVKHHAGPVGHQIHMRRFHPGRCPQGLLDMVLAGGTSHAQHRQGQRFSKRSRHLLFPVSRVTGFGQCGDGGRRGRLIVRLQARGTYAHFVHRDARSASQRLGHTPHTGATVHPVDSKRNLSHSFPT